MSQYGIKATGLLIMYLCTFTPVEIKLIYWAKETSYFRIVGDEIMKFNLALSYRTAFDLLFAV